MKICQFWGWEVMPLVQKYGKKYGNFPFSHGIIKQNHICISLSHIHKKQNDSLEGNLDLALFAAKLEFS